MIFRSMESGEIVAKGISQNTWMINKTIEKGPLLSASTKKYLFFFNDATKTNNYILDFKTGYVSFNNYWAKNQKIMEVRQFNSDIIIYAIYATVIEGKAVCKYDHEDNFSTLAYSYDSADLIPGQICAIGYTWKSK